MALLVEGNYSVYQLPPYTKSVITCDYDERFRTSREVMAIILSLGIR